MLAGEARCRKGGFPFLKAALTRVVRGSAMRRGKKMLFLETELAGLWDVELTILSGCKQEDVKQGAVGRFGGCVFQVQSVVWISRQQPFRQVHAGTNAGAVISWVESGSRQGCLHHDGVLWIVYVCLMDTHQEEAKRRGWQRACLVEKTVNYRINGRD